MWSCLVASDNMPHVVETIHMQRKHILQNNKRILHWSTFEMLVCTWLCNRRWLSQVVDFENFSLSNLQMKWKCNQWMERQEKSIHYKTHHFYTSFFIISSSKFERRLKLCLLLLTFSRQLKSNHTIELLVHKYH